MPSVILSDNGVSSGSAGLKTTASNDGALALQTTTAGGSATTAVTIDTSQNVGIGTSSPGAKLSLTSTGNTTADGVRLTFGSEARSHNIYSALPTGRDLTIAPYRALTINTGSGTTEGVLTLNAYEYTVFGTGSSYTERMRLDASGNLGIGTTSPLAKLDVAGTGARIRLAPSDATNNALVSFTNTGGTSYVGLDSTGGGLTSQYALNIYQGGAYPITFSTNSSERARIDSSGRLLVGTTSAFNSAYTMSLAVSGSTGGLAIKPGADGYTAAIFFNAAGTNTGTISVSSSTTTYNTSSDYRLKNSVVPMIGALAKVAALKPVTYKWNSDNSDGEGFIAHELAEVVPQCVTGEKDAVDEDGNPVYQGIDTSFLVATLTAALQELKAIVDAQAAEIAALKGN